MFLAGRMVRLTLPKLFGGSEVVVWSQERGQTSVIESRGNSVSHLMTATPLPITWICPQTKTKGPVRQGAAWI